MLNFKIDRHDSDFMCWINSKIEYWRDAAGYYLEIEDQAKRKKAHATYKAYKNIYDRLV